MGWHEADTSVVVLARPRRCFDVLIDCIGMPVWQVGLRACRVLSRDGQGRPKDVAFEVDAIVKMMKYTLRHSYEEPRRITGVYLEGDFKDFAGEWLMEEAASGETKVTFKVGIDPGAWVPGHIARKLNQQILRESVERLKTEVEQCSRRAERDNDPPQG
ncbi:MAG: SRPBCC family protein [Thermoleophilia bacterium]|nr:SRPBCC family protein [Thermoleophilia bacterium]